MDHDTIVGIQKMRRDASNQSKRYKSKEEAYKQALWDITKAATVGEMLDIAHRVLMENR